MFGKPKQFRLPGILILCSVFASPDSQGRDLNPAYACKQGAVTRFVEVVTEPGYACRVKYTKPGLTSFPWSARNDAGYCAPRAVGLVEKLGAAGWQCDSSVDLNSVTSNEGLNPEPSIGEIIPEPSAGEKMPETTSAVTTPESPAADDAPMPPVGDLSLLRSTEVPGAMASVQDPGSVATDEEVRSILLAQIERYGRYIESYHVVGKTCYFYPTEAEFGNLCGDEREEAVIVYTCEVDAGGWDQHLAVFHEIEPEPLVKEVGRSGFRQVSTYHINDKLLMLETERFALVEDLPSAKFAVEESAIQCVYTDASDWELLERE
jgi:hypothetical protein